MIRNLVAWWRVLVAELLYLDANHLRRRFCFVCDRQTIRRHDHHDSTVESAIRRYFADLTPEEFARLTRIRKDPG